MDKIAIAIRGAYGEGNFGDDALMFYLNKWFKTQGLDVTFVGKKNDYVTQFISNQNYVLKEDFHRYKCENLILGGGTQFFSFHKLTIQQSKWVLLIKNPRDLLKKFVSKIEKAILYKEINYEHLLSLGIGLGPFIPNSLQVEIAKQKLSSMDFIAVRDNYSYKFSKQCNSNTYLGTDICFLPGLIDFNKLINTSQKIKKIGVIVRDWNYTETGDKYMLKLFIEIRELSRLGYEITFIYFKPELRCQKYFDKLSLPKIEWQPDKESIEEFLFKISGFDLYVSSRFHGIIFGALMNIPGIAIEIEPKLGICKELLGDGVEVWHEPFNDSLVEMIKNFDLKRAKQALHDEVSKQNIKANEMFAVFLNQMK
jgi:polysaccharide pyruvyl transferase WcaK-like protein